MDDQILIRERAVRAAVRVVNEDLIRQIKAELFKQQVEFVDNPAREKAALCTRRAGKTSMIARYARIMSLDRPRSIIRVWAITRLRAKQLIWDELKLLDLRHKIQCHYNETELTARLSNGSEIRLLGADKDKEVQKKRGDKTVLEIVTEAQLFGPYLQMLVEDVAGPCLFDLKGTFMLEGTPGPLCVGHWYKISGEEDFAPRWTSRGDSKGLGAGWDIHRWSVLDNPHLPHARDELTLLKQKRRWGDDNPTYLREWQARWVNDLGALFYKFDPVRNTFSPDEVKPWGPGWEHTLGWDLGFRDDMALVVWGYHPARPELFEAFSWKKPGALSAEVVEQIKNLEARGFNFTRKVADTGGGGRMYVEDVMSRYEMHFEAAKKVEKYDHVRLLNDDLLGGFIKIQQDSELAREMSALARDLDWPPPNKPEAPPREDPRYPNHCCDAGLYAYRGAWHYLHREEPARVVVGSQQWVDGEVKRMEQFALDKAKKRKQFNWTLGDEESEALAEWE